MDHRCVCVCVCVCVYGVCEVVKPRDVRARSSPIGCYESDQPSLLYLEVGEKRKQNVLKSIINLDR
jgi:hypothetical protein